VKGNHFANGKGKPVRLIGVNRRFGAGIRRHFRIVR